MSSLPPDRDFLQQTLKAIARQDADRGVSADVEALLRRHVRTRPIRRHRTALAWVAVAAALLVAIGVGRFAVKDARPLSDESSVVVVAPSADGFLPLPNAHVPVADAHVVRMPIPRASLVSFGLDPSAPGTPDVVMADVVVGHDGIARSVRFVDLFATEELMR
jgi:hypothetical protein